jgi:hypothetical protein
MLKTISSFSQIELTNDKKYLILCDIDETILHFPDCDRDCKELIKDFCPKDLTYKEDLEYLQNMYRRVRNPTHTDPEGFVSMVSRINENNGKLMFLTARNATSEGLTKRQLEKIGIIDFEIHFTNATISKGEYIKRHIDLSEWENIIFIDDYDAYIKSVLNIHPQIVCYKFKIEATTIWPFCKKR